jgi:hypothetical protein
MEIFSSLSPSNNLNNIKTLNSFHRHHLNEIELIFVYLRFEIYIRKQKTKYSNILRIEVT